MSKICKGEFSPHRRRWNFILTQTANTYYPIAGEWGYSAIASATMTEAHHRIIACPFVPVMNVHGNRLSVNVGAISSGAYVRMGLYQDNGDFYPGRKIFDSGAVNFNATGFFDLSTDNWGFRSDNIFWVAYWASQSLSASFYLAAIPGPRLMNIGAQWPSLVDQGTPYGYASELVWNASTVLPDPFPSESSITYGIWSVEVYPPLLFVRKV